jgi:hypothetical protein
MKVTASVLLASELVLTAWVMLQSAPGNLAVLLLACNTVLLLWAATRLRRKPFCCR